MTNRELWIQIRRLILSLVALFDRYYGIAKAEDVTINEHDNIACP